MPTNGLKFQRKFCTTPHKPYDQFEFETAEAVIRDDKGAEVFRQEAEFPKHWSDNARSITASKYFYGPPDKRESSVKGLVDRVAETIRYFGEVDGYFQDSDSAYAFQDDLKALLVGQYGSFNSPVWFNVGLYHWLEVSGPPGNYRWDREAKDVVKAEDSYLWPQGSACFIQSVGDDMESILDLAKSEGMLFKYGSGTGTDLTPLRSTRESLSGGGKPSGPVSFMRIYDAIAGCIKSGGKTRRAAKMQTLRCTHPDILEFVRAKAREDQKARMLIAAGVDGSFNGEAYASVAFQNANFSVGVTDAFMKLASESRGVGDHVALYDLYGVKGQVVDWANAHHVLDEIAAGTWACGDPGVHYYDALNRWHTCPNSGPINTSNPCCFTGETLVRTSEGKLPIATLAQMARVGAELPMAFGFDFEANVPVLRKIEHAWKAGETKSLVEVSTDTGMVFRCTPEHRFYLRSGEAVEAKDLQPGMRLRKIGRSHSGTDPRATIETKTGSHYQARWMWEQANGAIPEGHEVHHVNGDRWDDRLSNLALKEKVQHRRDHSAGASNPRYIDCPDSLLVETFEAIESAPRKTWTSHQGVTAQRWNTHIHRNGLKGKVPLANKRGIRGMTWDQFTAWVESNRSLVNDTVAAVKVVELDEPVAVYDIEVEGVHNFGITTLDSKNDIVVSNSEYVFLDDSACNLASLNLMKFRTQEGRFDVRLFQAAVRVFITAQEILVDRVSYPTAKIARNSHDFRPLGLGYANLGGLLMSLGLAYDSQAGRDLAGAITAIMGAQANLTSQELGAAKGAFPGYEKNANPFREVMLMHGEAALAKTKDKNVAFADLWSAAWQLWNEVGVNLISPHGKPRNAQVTLLAPTGTIAFMMDCDTTGIEPALGLVTYKTLSGGGTIKQVNRLVPMALERLGYFNTPIRDMVKNIEDNGVIHGPGCEWLAPNHLPVFDTSFPPNGDPNGRCLSWRAHIDMMAAVQPFLSGAISKTVNMPNSATVEDIREAYVYGWKSGLKALAIYRDGCKAIQPVTTKAPEAEAKPEAPVEWKPFGEGLPIKRPEERSSVWPTGEFHAVEWVQAWVEARAENPNIGSDVQDMIGWFANAIMSGYDYAKGENRGGAGAVEAAEEAALNGELDPRTFEERLQDNIDRDRAVEIGLELLKENQALKEQIRQMQAQGPARVRLPDTRQALNHKFSVGGCEGYLNIGLFPSGQPGEVFCKLSKEGSTLSGLMDSLCTILSIALQYGVPLGVITAKLQRVKFEPHGLTGNKFIPTASSVVDYVAQFLDREFLGAEVRTKADQGARDWKDEIQAAPADGPGPRGPGRKIGPHMTIFDDIKITVDPMVPPGVAIMVQDKPAPAGVQMTGPPCLNCGAIMVPSGRCHTCPTCGSTGGCG